MTNREIDAHVAEMTNALRNTLTAEDHRKEREMSRLRSCIRSAKTAAAKAEFKAQLEALRNAK